MAPDLLDELGFVLIRAINALLPAQGVLGVKDREIMSPKSATGITAVPYASNLRINFSWHVVEHR